MALIYYDRKQACTECRPRIAQNIVPKIGALPWQGLWQGKDQIELPILYLFPEPFVLSDVLGRQCNSPDSDPDEPQNLFHGSDL